MGSVNMLKPKRGPTAEVESVDAGIARVLGGAAERIHADVIELRRRGLIDAEGRRISTELPDDMKPGAQRDFGG